jgi:hypothetical protein
MKGCIARFWPIFLPTSPLKGDGQLRRSCFPLTMENGRTGQRGLPRFQTEGTYLFPSVQKDGTYLLSPLQGRDRPYSFPPLQGEGRGGDGSISMLI